MHRFFVPLTAFNNGVVTFPEATASQMFNVLRMRLKETVLVLDNQGMEYKVELSVLNRHSAEGLVRASHVNESEPRACITLYLALSQREKFEWMLQKCTEVGAAGFVPIITSRTLVQDIHEAEKKLDRWQKIVQESAEQSGRGRIPPVYPVLRLEQAFQSVLPDAVRLVAWEQEQSCDLKAALANAYKNVHPMAILVGPEGGFANAEIAAARSAGFQSVTLGRRILRMETAAVVLTSLIMYELGEMKIGQMSW